MKSFTTFLIENSNDDILDHCKKHLKLLWDSREKHEKSEQDWNDYNQGPLYGVEALLNRHGLLPKDGTPHSEYPHYHFNSDGGGNIGYSPSQNKIKVYFTHLDDDDHELDGDPHILL